MANSISCQLLPQISFLSGSGVVRGGPEVAVGDGDDVAAHVVGAVPPGGDRQEGRGGRHGQHGKGAAAGEPRGGRRGHRGHHGHGHGQRWAASTPF